MGTMANACAVICVGEVPARLDVLTLVRAVFSAPVAMLINIFFGLGLLTLGGASGLAARFAPSFFLTLGRVLGIALVAARAIILAGTG